MLQRIYALLAFTCSGLKNPGEKEIQESASDARHLYIVYFIYKHWIDTASGN